MSIRNVPGRDGMNFSLYFFEFKSIKKKNNKKLFNGHSNRKMYWRKRVLIDSDFTVRYDERYGTRFDGFFCKHKFLK